MDTEHGEHREIARLIGDLRRAERERDELVAQLAAVTAERDDATARASSFAAIVSDVVAALAPRDGHPLGDEARRVTRERDVLRAQQAPLVACVDALRAAARDAGWRDADATGETLVAWVRRGEREACARIARAHVGQQSMRAPAPRWVDVGERIAAAIEERGE